MKTPIFREARKTNIKGVGNCLKRGAWTVCRFKEGLGEKRECF